MTRKRIIALCIVLAVIAGGFVVLATGAIKEAKTEGKARDIDKSIPEIVSGLMGLLRPSGSIRSDGKLYPVNTIEAIPIATEVPKGERLPVVGDKETLLKLLIDRGVLYDNVQQFNGGIFRGITTNDMFEPMMTPDMPAVSMDMPAETGGWGAEMALTKGEYTDDGGSFSKTNEQVEGVSEGDIVKTDGKYIYAMTASENTLRIIEADGANLKVVSTIRYGDVWDAEFYLIGNDRIAIIGNEYVLSGELPSVGDDEPPDIERRIAPGYYGWNTNNFTVMLIYDISDREAPEQTRRVSMDGMRVSTRVIGDIVYLVTNKSIWAMPYTRADSEVILPYCLDTAAGESYEPIGFDNMYYIPDSVDNNYLLVGAIDVYDDAAFEPEAYLGAGTNFYMSKNAMYITKHRWQQWSGSGGNDDMWDVNSELTDILRFAINGTDVIYTGLGTVKGSPINQYSLDEYKGYLRIATTDWWTGTFVTVLSTSNMQVVGYTEPLAPGERMQSMRFMADMGYVVTFQNTDPLFTIDLSDPYKPKVLGELKIPGFSQYLHPVGDGLMLGIGRDTQETYTIDANGEERVIGFLDIGMKASLFDVSDPFDPKEIDLLKLGEGWAFVVSNPRALMCDPSRSLYGFMMEKQDKNYNWSYEAILMSIKDGQLSIATTLKPDGYISMYDSRLCYIGNTLYLVHTSGIIAYNYSDFTQIGSLTF